MVTLSKCRSILTLFNVLTKLKTDYLPDWRRFCKFDAQKALKRYINSTLNPNTTPQNA